MKMLRLVAKAVVNPSEVGDLEPAVAVSSDLARVAFGSKQNKVLLWKILTQ